MLNSTQLAEAARSNEQSRQLQAMGEALLGANNNGLAVVPGVGGVLRGQLLPFRPTLLQAPAGYRLIIDWLSPGNGDPVTISLSGPQVGYVMPGSVLTNFDCGGAVVSLEDGYPILLYHYEPILPADGLLALWPAGSLVDSIFGRRWEVSEDDYVYPVGQYDEMQRGVNEAYTTAAVLTLPDSLNGNVYLFNKDGLTLIRLRGSDSNLLSYVSTVNPFYEYTPDVPLLAVTVYDPAITSAFFYIDGVEVDASNSVNPFTAAAAAADFTRYDSSGATFGAFAMWNRALSPAEIAALGTGESPNFPTV